jgi:hypothetical protein
MSLNPKNFRWWMGSCMIFAGGYLIVTENETKPPKMIKTE